MSIVLYVLAIGFGIFAIVYYAVKKKPVLRSIGLTFNRWLAVDLLVGFAIVFVVIGLVFLVELLLGAITISGGSLTVANLFSGLIGPIVLFAVIEELLYRVFLVSGVAILFSRLKYGRWLTVVLTAALFGLAHATNTGATAITIFGTGLGGLIYGIAFLTTRSVWLGLGAHISWNMSQALFGLPVSGTLFPGWFAATPAGPEILSGGDYGPEAGIPGMIGRFVIIALILFYVKLRWPGGSIATLRFAPDPEKKRQAAAPVTDPSTSV